MTTDTPPRYSVGWLRAQPRATLTTAEAARVLGVSNRVAIGLARSGELPAHRVGAHWRFSIDGLIRWLDVE